MGLPAIPTILDRTASPQHRESFAGPRVCSAPAKARTATVRITDSIHSGTHFAHLFESLLVTDSLLKLASYTTLGFVAYLVLAVNDSFLAALVRPVVNLLAGVVLVGVLFWLFATAVGLLESRA